MNIGDSVSYTHVSQRGKQLTMSLREGTITAINGNMAEVKLKNGKRKLVAMNRLRLPGQKSQITEFVEAVTGKQLPHIEVAQ